MLRRKNKSFYEKLDASKEFIVFEHITEAVPFWEYADMDHEGHPTHTIIRVVEKKWAVKRVDGVEYKRLMGKPQQIYLGTIKIKNRIIKRSNND